MLDCKKAHTIDCNSTVYRSLVGGGGSISDDGGGGGCSEGGRESRGGEDGCGGSVWGGGARAPTELPGGALRALSSYPAAAASALTASLRAAQPPRLRGASLGPRKSTRRRGPTASADRCRTPAGGRAVSR